MNKAVPAIIGVATAGGLIFLLTRKAAGVEECYLIGPGRDYYYTYTGPRRTFRSALGECYPVIYTIDIYDPETDDWIPPADPEHDFIETGNLCRVIVQGQCKLCGFTPIV